MTIHPVMPSSGASSRSRPTTRAQDLRTYEGITNYVNGLLIGSSVKQHFLTIRPHTLYFMEKYKMSSYSAPLYLSNMKRSLQKCLDNFNILYGFYPSFVGSIEVNANALKGYHFHLIMYPLSKKQCYELEQLFIQEFGNSQLIDKKLRPHVKVSRKDYSGIYKAYHYFMGYDLLNKRFKPEYLSNIFNIQIDLEKISKNLDLIENKKLMYSI